MSERNDYLKMLQNELPEAKRKRDVMKAEYEAAQHWVDKLTSALAEANPRASIAKAMGMEETEAGDE